MKKLAIMQPYLVPYLGYFQLTHAVDELVVYDDVQYMKGGWINRNRVLINSGVTYVGLPVQRASIHLRINERDFAEPFAKNKARFRKQVQQGYAKAPCHEATMALLRELLASPDRNVASFITRSLRLIAEHLGISTQLVSSSALGIATDKQGQDRVLAIAAERQSDVYINVPGGRSMYDPEAFAERGIELRFIVPADVTYDQRSRTFVPNLSIIDVLMHNSPEDVRDLLSDYTLSP